MAEEQLKIAERAFDLKKDRHKSFDDDDPEAATESGKNI